MNNLLIFLLIMLVFVNGGCCEMKLIDYESVIQRAKISNDFDGRIELRQCVKRWEMFKNERVSFFNELTKHEIFTASHFLMLESGNASFGEYNYACIWKNKQSVYMLTNMTGGSEKKIRRVGIELIDFENLLEQMHIQRLGQASGLASNKVDDGDCFFITAKLKDKISQFAVYAPNDYIKSVDISEKIVNILDVFIKTQIEKNKGSTH